MSFRLFVYYCAVGGAWSGLIGWMFGEIIAPRVPPGSDSYFRFVLHDALMGLFLGFAVAFGLSFLDAIFSVSLRQLGKVFLRVVMAVLVGIFAGMFGGFLGSSLLYLFSLLVRNLEWDQSAAVTCVRFIIFVIGWTITGFLIGMSIGFFDLVSSLLMRQNVAGSLRKLRNCLIGGTVGGILGGIIAFMLSFVAGLITQRVNLWTPTAWGFVAIGAFIGLLVGLAQIILKEAWIKVEAGFRPGREMILAKDKTSIGRAEGSDIALFGDAGVEKAHANIVLEGGRYFLEDLQTPGGSYVNEQKVQGRTPLKAGDLIRISKSVLRFNERAKRKD